MKLGNPLWHRIATLIIVAALTACSTLLSQNKSLPTKHPEALGEKRVNCSECHDDQAKGSIKALSNFNHSPLFVREHKLYAASSDRLCSVCHTVSFCNDCHATKNELKPSQKLGNRPDRDLIHRGDYMTRHRIEGKIDPASCYKCHGRTNNEQCRSCHR